MQLLHYLHRYGLPDFDQQRECDMSLKLRMSSVRYIHTQRFLTELIAFVQNFLQLQDVLGRMRAASVGKKVGQLGRVFWDLNQGPLDPDTSSIPTVPKRVLLFSF